MKQPIYLDYAAATPVDPAVLAAMQPYYSQKFYNPSATYLAAKEVAADLEAARASVARQLGARPSEIIFTAGGTEANNLAIQGVLEAFPEGKLLTTAVEHDSVLEPARAHDAAVAPVDGQGSVDLVRLEKSITDKTVLVSVMYANNEVGTIQPVKEVSQLLGRVRAGRQKKGNKRPLYLHTDACQAANYLDLQVARLGVDLLTLNGGKIYGPKQSGVLYVKTGVKLVPQILGGGQELGRRSGTENVAQAVGMAKALEMAAEQRGAETKRLAALRDDFIKQLEAAVPGVIINGSRKQRLPNNIHFTIPGTDNERLMMQLDEQGVQVAVGSACSASNEEPSHVLKAMGLSDAEAQASLRLTLGRLTTEADLRRCFTILRNAL